MLKQSSPIDDPVDAIMDRKSNAVLAIIEGVEGPSYRPVGALMAVFDDGTRVGTLSSGCVEEDISHHALRALETGDPVRLRYGLNSPFFDIVLPCGGGLDILLIPNPDKKILSQLQDNRSLRKSFTLAINTTSGEMQLLPESATAFPDNILLVKFCPANQFFIFGKGPEASAFARLVASVGYANILLSPDIDTINAATLFGLSG